MAIALAATGISAALVADIGAFALISSIAIERAALTVLATPAAVESAVGLDSDVLCVSELGAGQGGERGETSSERFDRGPPVSSRGDLPR
ncbi:MAG TPA: hypothetical protein VHG52_02890 [Thermomicrobiales bacterium]|nr:hypothetical protein [Thermomicrobiales bacterium]